MTWFFFISCQIIDWGEEKQSSEWGTQKDIVKEDRQCRHILDPLNLKQIPIPRQKCLRMHKLKVLLNCNW